jgi:hypothetical protein
MLDKITWPVVALIGLILAAVVTMAALKADLSAITNIIVLLGLGGGLGVLTGVKSNVNGNLKQLVELMGSAMEHLAHAQPVDDKDKL